MPNVTLNLNPVAHRPISGAVDHASLGPSTTNAFAPLVFSEALSGLEISAQNTASSESTDHENLLQDPTELPMAESGSSADLFLKGGADNHAAKPNPLRQDEGLLSDKVRLDVPSHVEMANFALPGLNKGNRQPWAAFRAGVAMSDVLKPSEDAFGFANFSDAQAIPADRKATVQAIGSLSTGGTLDELSSLSATAQIQAFPMTDKAAATLPDITIETPLARTQSSMVFNVPNVDVALPYLSTLNAVKKTPVQIVTDAAFPKAYMGQISVLGVLDDEGAMASAIENIPQATPSAATVNTTQTAAFQVPSGPVGTAIAHASINHIAQAVFASPGDRFEIFLSPEELGRVRIHMHQSELGLQVLISTERPETMDLLRKNISLLSRSLSDLGFGSPSFQFDDQGRDNKRANRHFDMLSSSDGLPSSASDAQPQQSLAIEIRGLDLRF